MGIVASCFANDLQESKSELLKQLEANQRWSVALGSQLDIKDRELASRSLDIQTERDKNDHLQCQINRLEREIEILKSILKHSEKEEERLRTELIRAYNELRKSRSNLNRATDQLRYHVGMRMEREEETEEDHCILTKSTPV